MTTQALTFNNGKIVCSRWKIICKLGSGGCGSVYKVEDLKNKGYIAALKAEPILEDDTGVLKLEAGVLKKLSNRKNVIRLLQSGKRAKYNFIVITICGFDLMSLKRKSAEGFSESTILRIGLHALYSIKQLHEIGFVHRDVKPGNMMNGISGRDKRIIFLIDYGMVRSFMAKNTSGQLSIRKPRKAVLLRGTLRYCSLNVHSRSEQGRVDDIWAMLYTLGELYMGLPWNKTSVEKEIVQKKETMPDEEVFKESPQEFVDLAKYLRTLTYQDRPDYFKIYDMFMSAMRREKYSLMDKYDWEEDEPEVAINTAVELSDREKKSFKPLSAEEKEFQLYSNLHPKNFKEIVLPF